MRLTFLFVVASATVMPLFGLSLSRSAERHFEEEDAAELHSIADAVQRTLFTLHSERDLSSLQQRFDDILIGHHHASMYLLDENWRTVYASHGPELPVVSRIRREHAATDWRGAVRFDTHDHRVLMRRIPGADPSAGPYGALVVAVPIDRQRQFLSDFRATLWVMVVTSIATMSLIGWFAVRQGHAPLHQIVSGIRQITANETDTHLDPDSVPRDLRDLVLSVNEMLRRMHAAIQRLREFNADTAHELRTPITNLMTQVQVSLSRSRHATEYREVLFSCLEEFERMAKMVDDMLFLAKTDETSGVPEPVDVDLDAEVRLLFEYYELLASERGVMLVQEGFAWCRGDRLMLRRALGNLLSNAIRHTPAGETVRVGIATDDRGQVVIVVENPGPEIPADHLERVFDRFYRVDPSRHREDEGSGLGLAIVKSIVTAHGGSVKASSAQGRTRFSMILPPDPDGLRS